MQTKIYIFCDKDINDYEKTIYTLAMAYADSPMFELDVEIVSDLAQLLMVDEELLSHALLGNTDCYHGQTFIKFGNEAFDCSEFFKNTFFTSIIKLHLAYNNLNKISDQTTEEAIRENINLIESIVFFFDSINAADAAYECVIDHQFSLKHTLFDSGNFPPIDYLKMLKMLLVYDDYMEYEEALISITLILAQYELRTRLNALYLVLITQIIMHSPFFEVDIHKMALEMYEHLMFMLKNGRIISIQVNSLFFDPGKRYDGRILQDNTTRFQILYGYENYDTYVMRVDLSHQGQPFVHFNNSSPGEVHSNLFTQEEYEYTLVRYPLLESCFIEYGRNRWALKERSNCELTKEMAEMYEQIESEKAHKEVFTQDFLEKSIVEFTYLIANILPPSCLVPIDKDGEHARRCFNYDILMRNTTWLYLAFIEGDVTFVDCIIDDIVTKAYNYGLISEDVKNESKSLFTICYILCLAEEKANITP